MARKELAKGGLIALPALLSLGFPPVGAIATTKAQSAVGTAIAARTYWRRGLVDVRSLLPAMAATYLGSLGGAFTVQHVDTSHLAVGIPVALIASVMKASARGEFRPTRRVSASCT